MRVGEFAEVEGVAGIAFFVAVGVGDVLGRDIFGGGSAGEYEEFSGAFGG